MPNGIDPGQDPGAFLTHGIMGARPRVFSPAVTGMAWGAGAGAAVGGMPGAAIGAGIGALLGTLTSAATRLTTVWRGLEKTSRSLVERFKDINPAMARMRGQWEQLDRRLNRAWARTIAPLLQSITDIAADFKLRWNKMKMEFFVAMAPHLEKLLSFVKLVGDVGMHVAKAFFDVLASIVKALTEVLDLLGLLKPPGKRKPGVTELLATKFPWAAEGPLAAQTFGRGEVGRFASRKSFPGGPEEAEEPEAVAKKRPRGVPAQIEEMVGPYAEKFWREVLGERAEKMTYRHILDWLRSRFEGEEEKPKTPGVSVNINVRDSAELASAVERIVAQAVGALRQVEANDAFARYQLGGQGTYA